MIEGLDKDTLTAPDSAADSELTPGGSPVAEVEDDSNGEARLPDLAVGDMETDLPSRAAEPVTDRAEAEPLAEEEMEIPWGDVDLTAEADEPEAEEEAAPESTPEVGVATAEAPAATKQPLKHAWYVVHCYSGYENKVKKGLEQRINSMGMQDRIFRVVVPVEKEVEIKEGQRRNIERRVFPGYILVEMAELQEGDPESDQAWYVVRNTPGVTGFVSSAGLKGESTRPVPLRQDEVDKILKRMETDEPKVHVTFRVGQTVHIIDGPFADFRGQVENVDMTKGKVRVLVSFFGRETPVELDLLQVEKV